LRHKKWVYSSIFFLRRHPTVALIFQCVISDVTNLLSSIYYHLEKINPVIWKEQVVLVVGSASSRDHLISRLEADPTGVFLW